MERIRRQRLWDIPVVATRQNHNGMSWSKSGSGALAIITAAGINGELENWMAGECGIQDGRIAISTVQVEIYFFFYPHTLTFRLNRPAYRGFSSEGRCEGVRVKMRNGQR